MNKTFVFMMLFWIVGASSILYLDYRDDYTYRAYILHDQYIGDIMIDGKPYIGILIMDVEPLRNKEKDMDLYYNERKYGWYLSCVVDSDDPYHGVIKTGDAARLYFVGENNIRCDLVNGEAIGVRWTNPIIGKHVIHGVGPLKSGFI